MTNTSKILITGGYGFIGSNMAYRLQQTHDIIIADWLSEGTKWHNVRDVQIYKTVNPWDYNDEFNDNFADIKAIIHMGAISSTVEQNVGLIMENNFEYSRQLWDIAVKRGIPFIYASSAATYGNGEQGFKDSEDPAYLAQLKPMNAYGWSKHVFDRFVVNEAQQGRPTPPQWAGLKFFNVYGEFEEHKDKQRSVISQLYQQIKRGEAAKLFKSYKEGYEDGGQLRDFVYVEDVCNVMLWLLANPDVSGLYNVGSGQARSFKDLALATFAAMDVAPNIKYIEMPEQIRGHYQYFTEAPMDKLLNKGYQNKPTSLEEATKQYVQEFLKPYYE